MARRRSLLVAVTETLAGLALSGVSVAVIVRSSGALDDVAVVALGVGIGATVHGAVGTSPRQDG